MKKELTCVLVLFLILSLSGAVHAEGSEWVVSCSPALTLDTITTSTVTIQGSWDPTDTGLTVTADPTVNLYLNGDPNSDYVVVPVSFNEVSRQRVGSETTVSVESAITVDPEQTMKKIKIGSWSGSVTLYIDTVSSPIPTEPDYNTIESSADIADMVINHGATTNFAIISQEDKSKLKEEDLLIFTEATSSLPAELPYGSTMQKDNVYYSVVMNTVHEMNTGFNYCSVTITFSAEDYTKIRVAQYEVTVIGSEEREWVDRSFTDNGDGTITISHVTTGPLMIFTFADPITDKIKTMDLENICTLVSDSYNPYSKIYSLYDIIENNNVPEDIHDIMMDEVMNELQNPWILSKDKPLQYLFYCYLDGTGDSCSVEINNSNDKYTEIEVRGYIEGEWVDIQSTIDDISEIFTLEDVQEGAVAIFAK